MRKKIVVELLVGLFWALVVPTFVWAGHEEDAWPFNALWLAAGVLNALAGLRLVQKSWARL